MPNDRKIKLPEDMQRSNLAGKNKDFSTFSIWGTKATAGIAVLSTIYFLDICLRARAKCFWFDELFTTYLCRLPNFQDTWQAVSHGADFNPPLLYLMTRGSQWLLGEGLIATRLPAMLGVWLFCICLYSFVARRAGLLAGLIAGVFPFFTLVQYYAYEARAHGIVLGWCGLSLICWQRHADGQRRLLWLMGFTVCLAGALLTHVYAVYLIFPFALVELYHWLRKGQPDWSVLGALALALSSVTVTVYLPLFHAYRSTVSSSFFAGSHDAIQRFLVIVIGPAIDVLVVYIVLLALTRRREVDPAYTAVALHSRELVLAVGLICIPIFGLLGSKISHGPFIERYFLASVAGYAILLGFSTYRCRFESSTARLLSAFIVLLMIADLSSAIYLNAKKRLVLMEPSAGLALSTTPDRPMERYESVLAARTNLDLIVLRQVHYLYFFRYAPASALIGMSYAAPADDLFLKVLAGLGKGAGVSLSTTTFASFLATHSRFLAYGNGDGADLLAIQTFAKAGYTLRSATIDAGGVMYEYAK